MAYWESASMVSGSSPGCAVIGLEHGHELGDLVGAGCDTTAGVGAVVVRPRPADRPSGVAQAGAVRADRDHGETFCPVFFFFFFPTAHVTGRDQADVHGMTTMDDVDIFGETFRRFP